VKHLLCVGLLPLIATSALAQVIAQGKAAALPSRPDALVSRFYEQVVARHPLGMPYGADMKVFAPYLSKALRHRLDVSEACFADWHRQNPDPNLKPPSTLLEDGLFSGPSEKAEPKTFHIERIEPGSNGSSRVTVRLTWEDPSSKPYFWYVAAVVVSESGHLAVDDVLYLEDMGGEPGSRLSEALTRGCKGAHWIGYDPSPR
jgi:hypothetical protein